MKNFGLMFFKNRWGRGQPDDIGAINLGDEKFDPDSDKKPRAGQILWIRGLTRLQTQVTIPISLSLITSLFLSLFSLYLSLLLYSLSLSHFIESREKIDISRPSLCDISHSICEVIFMHINEEKINANGDKKMEGQICRHLVLLISGKLRITRDS